MSDRDVRAAEWDAFSTLLEARADQMSKNARAKGSPELAMVALAVMAVSADAAKIAAAIRSGAPPTPDEAPI